MADEKFEVEIFKGKTFGKLLEEVHSNSINNKKLLHGLIEDLKEFIENIGSAIQLAPIIASYTKLLIDNDEHIIKMASIVQKSLEKAKASGNESDAMFTKEDLESLRLVADEIEETLELPDTTQVRGLLTQKPVKKSKK